MQENHQVLYRKYRPKTFAEIVGQEHIVRTLQNAVALGKVAHAYLFAGPRGTGKTTIARLLAKAVNCETRKREGENGERGAGNEHWEEACNACDTCTAFLSGNALDLIEIDAASNRGIDEIRNLREAVRFSPVSARYKVYIIDETHMLTKEAFNALLKMLEEPPAHALFILATTEISKVPVTIRSRCQRFDFGRLPFETLSRRLKALSAHERVKIGEDAIALLARLADGSCRDAESLLDQVLSTGKAELRYDEVCATLGIASRELLQKFLSALLARDTRGALAAINGTLEQGTDPHQFLREIIQVLRDGTIVSFGEQALEELIARERGKEYVAWLKTVVMESNAEALRELLDIFLAASVRMRHTPLPQLPLELAVMEATQPKQIAAGNS